jgi:hypothetical protein
MTCTNTIPNPHWKITCNIKFPCSFSSLLIQTYKTQTGKTLKTNLSSLEDKQNLKRLKITTTGLD